jgi:hypothetical protein
VRADVVDVAKDGTAASQTLSRWDPGGDWGSGSNGNHWNDAESSDGQITHGRGRTTSSTKSPPGSLLESTQAYPPPGWMVSHDVIADGDQLLLLPTWDHSPPPQTPTEVPRCAAVAV